MTLRLAATAVGHYEELDGYAVAHNMPPLEKLPLRRFSSFVYWMITRNSNEQQIAKTRAQLWMPPKGVEPTDERSPWNPENEKNALMALKAQLGQVSAPS